MVKKREKKGRESASEERDLRVPVGKKRVRSAIRVKNRERGS